MALIKCSECGAKISDKSTTCVYCGAPVKKRFALDEGEIWTGDYILFTVFLFVGVIGMLLYDAGISPIKYFNQDAYVEKDKDRNTNSYANTHEDDKPVVDKLALKIVSKTYSWSEDGSYASISFEPTDNPSVGAATIKGTIHALEWVLECDREALDVVLNPNDRCIFVYEYSIRDIYVSLKFVKSTCNYDGDFKSLSFDESGKYYTLTKYGAFSNTGNMVFKAYK